MRPLAWYVGNRVPVPYDPVVFNSKEVTKCFRKGIFGDDAMGNSLRPIAFMSGRKSFKAEAPVGTPRLC